MLADMDEDRLVAEVEAIRSEDSNPAYFAGDLREKLTQANLISATIAEFDHIDILVNASRQVALSDPLNQEDDGFEALLEQNVTANLRLSQIVARRMIKQAEDAESTEGCIGTIVNLSSIASHRVLPELMSYSIASAALDQLTRSFAVALAQYRIRVNGVAFGSIMTASLQNQLREDSELRQMVTDATPLARIGQADDVTEAVQYLASEAAGFVTGQILTVDGGRSLLDRVERPAH